MRRWEQEEDSSIVRVGSSGVSKDRFKKNEKKKQAGPLNKYVLISLGIIAYVMTTYIIVRLTASEVGDDRVANLQSELSKVMAEQKQAINKLNKMQKALNKYQLQWQQQQTSKKEIPAVKIGKIQKVTINAVNSKPESGSQLSQGLKAISEKRTQKAGMVNIPDGTVCELRLLMKNGNGKTIDQVIYKDEETRKKRIQFQKQRIQFLGKNTNHQSLSLVKYNMKYDNSYDEEQERVERQEYNRIRGIHNLDSIKQEMPMCMVVPGYNNNAKFRLEYNLNSIFSQNYTNYFVVIINDASTDGSDELFRNYLHFYNIDKSKYAYIENKKRVTALENIYIATHQYCSLDSVVLNMDGDDEFIGKNVLKIFNAQYQQKKSGVMYSNFYWYEQGGNLMYGFTSEYTESEKSGNLYRQSPQRFSHLRTYRTKLFRKIDKKDFQDAQGKFYTSAYDMAMYFPLMELSCQRINKIAGYHYLYNINTGLNDYAVDRNKQATIDGRVRSSKKYDCDPDFKKETS